MNHCQNCNCTLQGEYCGNCGQRDISLDRPILVLLRDLLKETFEVDGKAFRTIRTMLFRPGELTREFLAGRRRYYTSPLRLYLVISVVFFVFIGWFAQQGALLNPGQNVGDHAPSQAHFLSETLPRLMFLLLPAFALLLKIAFRHRLYFDHLIHAMHVHGLVYIGLAVMLPFENIAHWSAVAIQSAVLAYVMAYMLWSVRNVYRAGWGIAVLKTLLVLVAYFGLISLVIEATSSIDIISD